MKAVIQRVSSASVAVDGQTVGEIKKGFLVLLGVCQDDTADDMALLAKKTANLRIFTDENDKMNLSLLDVDGGALVISNFTLCADTRKGNRPSFICAMEPDGANRLYEGFCEELLKNGVKTVQKGIFGADMKVQLLNDGPITIILDTEVFGKK